RVLSRVASSAELVDPCLEIALPGGERRLARGEASLEAVHETLERSLAHAAIVLRRPAGTTEREEQDRDHESCCRTATGAESDQPADPGPGGRRRSRGLARDLDGRIGLALEAAQRRETPRDSGGGRGRALLTRHGGHQFPVAMDR